jgi:hypothetical protein
LLNNLIKDTLETPLKGNYLAEWRSFVGHIHSSNPFKELWDEICTTKYNKLVGLQPDCITLFSSTITMLAQAVSVKEAVEMMYKWTISEKEWEKHHVCTVVSSYFLIYRLMYQIGTPQLHQKCGNSWLR